MTLHKYILDADGNPQVEPDLLKWATWFENGEFRRVALDVLPNGVKISTVFLGLDHNFALSGPPILWETMTFAEGRPQDGTMRRYANAKAAKAGHAEIVLGEKLKMQAELKSK